ncbi:metallophosphoesterase [Nocardia farcinica]|uniref:metallophosphoesterase family protein n=1 Tax=Nocardia farcinica TaxID=37329 RepID=UPI00189380A3|nr:metallophosphoesterase [Nocardia farcinica]MBF6263530.1 metallophosphoesterase [Nocardia farcinica]MBF6282143.1 metallophosphoesterase [Nocardia farcinica]MBF6306443.1 metallophosphoesterase [Nocardia farcinica]MBF6392677.1 metallophosphoesterase [Nocardia farcinica]MBF6489499.1 metallophosphoesterase [Nocardia farcinica]
MTRVLAVSDLHVGHPGNREVVDLIRPTTPDDWLIVAGDVGERIEHIRGVLAELRARFAKVIWVPGNHELWTTARDPSPRRGEGRYRRLIAECRALGVLTPEDPYPVWEGPGGPVALVPMFLLYDYTFLPRGARTKADALELARARGTVATDEQLLAHEPYDSREQWCRARVEHTRSRLDAMDPALPLVLINHFPLLREQTRMLWHAEFAPWCGTVLTADWHRTYPVRCVVYGHLHIRRTDHFDSVRFEEVSLGYPREWRRRGLPDPLLREILPGPSSSVVGARARRAVGGAVRAATALTRPAAARRGRTTP